MGPGDQGRRPPAANATGEPGPGEFDLSRTKVIRSVVAMWSVGVVAYPRRRTRPGVSYGYCCAL